LSRNVLDNLSYPEIVALSGGILGAPIEEVMTFGQTSGTTGKREYELLLFFSCSGTWKTKIVVIETAKNILMALGFTEVSREGGNGRI